MKSIKHITFIFALMGSGHFAQAVKPVEQEALALEWAFITAGLNTGRQLLLTWHAGQTAVINHEDENNSSDSEEDTEDDYSSSYDSELEALYESCTNDADYRDGLHALIAEQEATLTEQDEQLAKLQAELAKLNAQKENEGTSQEDTLQEEVDLAAVERRAINDFFESIDSDSEDESDSIDSEELEAELERLKAELAAAAKWKNENA